MKVWITRWALTSGIIVTRDAESHGGKGGIVAHVDNMVCEQPMYFSAAEWHPSEDAATRRFNKMKELELHRLANRLAKVQVMQPKFIETVKLTSNDQGGSDDHDDTKAGGA